MGKKAWNMQNLYKKIERSHLFPLQNHSKILSDCKDISLVIKIRRTQYKKIGQFFRVWWQMSVTVGKIFHWFSIICSLVTLSSHEKPSAGPSSPLTDSIMLAQVEFWLKFRSVMMFKLASFNISISSCMSIFVGVFSPCSINIVPYIYSIRMWRKQTYWLYLMRQKNWRDINF